MKQRTVPIEKRALQAASLAGFAICVAVAVRPALRLPNARQKNYKLILILPYKPLYPKILAKTT